MARQLVAALLLCVAAWEFGPGTAVAQAVAPPEVPLQAVVGQSPEWMRGRWSENCSRYVTEIGPDYIVSRSSTALQLRFETAFTADDDVVIVRVRRVTTWNGPDPAPPDGTFLIMRRLGDHLRLLASDDPGRPIPDRGASDLRRCN